MFFCTASRYALMALIAVQVALPSARAQQAAVTGAQETAYQRELKKEAALNLYRLKRSIEKDGFYSARIALNIWRSSSLRAGTFDPQLYEEMKTRLYEKAMTDSLNSYRYFMRLKDASNARTCMLIWRSHAKEIDRYDPVVYQKLQEGVERLKKKKQDEGADRRDR
jgi:hypothetical protein